VLIYLLNCQDQIKVFCPGQYFHISSNRINSTLKSEFERRFSWIFEPEDVDVAYDEDGVVDENDLKPGTHSMILNYFSKKWKQYD
jgi:hypothetical protein